MKPRLLGQGVFFLEFVQLKIDDLHVVTQGLAAFKVRYSIDVQIYNTLIIAGSQQRAEHLSCIHA
ncbi:MAG: hypothetical protein CSA35_01930 [Dethiosulfovibrio peptidovorans]|nr:MAG: hypothetical protein CSA35_01930 [Dethiosulfovibrio peptidovorans]